MLSLQLVVEEAVEDGLVGAAVLDRRCVVLASAGEFSRRFTVDDRRVRPGDTGGAPLGDGDVTASASASHQAKTLTVGTVVRRSKDDDRRARPDAVGAGAAPSAGAGPRLIVSVVMRRFKDDSRRARLDDGELLELELDGRMFAVGIAAKRAFVIAELAATRVPAQRLHQQATHVIREMLAVGAPIVGDDGGGGSGPAELPVIEWGVTVRANN